MTNPTYPILLEFRLERDNIQSWLKLLQVCFLKLGPSGLFEERQEKEISINSPSINSLGFRECEGFASRYWEKEKSHIKYEENIFLKICEHQDEIRPEQFQYIDFIFEDPRFFENINLRIFNHNTKKTSILSVNPLFAIWKNNQEFILHVLKKVKTHLKHDFKDWVLENKMVFLAVGNKLPEVLRFILEEVPTSVNSLNYIGETPAMMARETQILEILATHGADLNSKNKQGKTVLTYLQEIKDDAARQELTHIWKRHNKKGEANQNDVSNQILTTIAKNRNKKESEILIKFYKGEHSKIYDQDKRNLLNLAAKVQKETSGFQMPIIKTLYNDYHLDVTEPDNDKICALQHFIFLSVRRSYDIESRKNILESITREKYDEVKNSDKYASFLYYYLKYNNSHRSYYYHQNEKKQTISNSADISRAYGQDIKDIEDLYDFQKGKVLKEHNKLLPYFFEGLRHNNFHEELEFFYEKTSECRNEWEGFFKEVLGKNKTSTNKEKDDFNDTLIRKLIESTIMDKNPNFILFLTDEYFKKVAEARSYYDKGETMKKFQARVEQLKVNQALKDNKQSIKIQKL